MERHRQDPADDESHDGLIQRIAEPGASPICRSRWISSICLAVDSAFRRRITADCIAP